MWNVRMILTGLNFAEWRKWKELNQGDVRGRHGVMVSRKIWKDLVCPGRMYSLRENRERKLRGRPANPDSPGGWLLNRHIVTFFIIVCLINTLTYLLTYYVCEMLCRYESVYNQYTGSTTLSIFNMRDEDEGEYSCRAFNVAGESTTSAFLLHRGFISLSIICTWH